MRFREEAIKAFRSFHVGGIIEALKGSRAPRQSGNADQDDHLGLANDRVSKQEFMLRYRNARMTSLVPLTFFIYTFIAAVFADARADFLTMLLLSVFLLLGYLQGSFSLWRARMSWSEWEKEEKVSLTLSDFIDAIAIEPKQVFPLSIGACSK